jgi:glycine/D-amino acid oxidase-like deaminating enzyme
VLGERGVQTIEGVETTAVERVGDLLRVVTDSGEFVTRSLVVTAGHGTNALLARLPGCELQVPLHQGPAERGQVRHPALRTRASVHGGRDAGDRLSRHRDLLPSDHRGPHRGREDRLLQPADMPRGTTSVDSVAAFIEQCMPGLAGAELRDVEDVDQCDYDLVADDDFVLGAVPGVASAFVGVGWRGTGYKFAPWVGRVLADLALRAGSDSDIDRFDPARFLEGGSSDGPSVTADPAAAPR